MSVKMIGPGGPGHCSVMDCLNKFDREMTYEVRHPTREPYLIAYYFCTAHLGNAPDAERYPNFFLKE